VVAEVVVVDWVRRLGGLGLAVGDSRFDAMLEMGCGRVQSPVSPRFSGGVVSNTFKIWIWGSHFEVFVLLSFDRRLRIVWYLIE
jgi:hypothetical protein